MARDEADQERLDLWTAKAWPRLMVVRTAVSSVRFPSFTATISLDCYIDLLAMGCGGRQAGRSLGVSIDLLAQKYRADFPILEQRVNGLPLVYLDNAASTQHPTCVIDEICR